MKLERTIESCDNEGYWVRRKIEEMERQGWTWTGEMAASKDKVFLTFVKLPEIE